jgi:predicted enzyme related to lactoylglutathione lyase
VRMKRAAMPAQARYVHTNLIARDWRRLARFYEQVLGCSPVPPERHLCGPWLEQATGLAGAEIRGIHLRLPGHGDRGPTLEIFEYGPALDRIPAAVNRPGFAHIAFAVEDVPAARQAVLAAGGGEVGTLTTVNVPGAGNITFVYLTDPEGNILELQRWG